MASHPEREICSERPATLVSWLLFSYCRQGGSSRLCAPG
nr:MAG TPA: hypothetical protein [Caudoviricetes sp.]